MSRVHKWQAVMAAEFDAARDRPFKWNGWSCFDFVAHVYIAITGADDPRDLFPRYRTEAEAEAVMAAEGGPAGILTRVLGEPVHPAWAQRGDIVLADFGRGPQPGVCAGLWTFSPGARGLEHRPTLQAINAWKVV